MIRPLIAAATALLLGSGAHAAEPAPIPIRVVVVTTFEIGQDTGDKPGEFQAWVERYPLPATLPFPVGYRALRYNPDQQVLGIVTGEGKSHAAASIMALGLDPRFDLSKAYWILAGIAGIDPARASVGSASWATHVVDGDLAYEIDGREIPPDWPTGIVPYERATPYQKPIPDPNNDEGHQAYTLNPQLVEWAYRLTKDTVLPDDAKLQAARAGYASQPNAQRPPFVLKGDTLTCDRFWVGAKFNRWSEDWVAYWTRGEGSVATSAEEDTGFLQALSFLAQARRVDLDRVLDLRTGSDFTVPPDGQNAVQFLATEADNSVAAYSEALEAAYRIGSLPVREIATHWARYADHLPTPP